MDRIGIIILYEETSSVPTLTLTGEITSDLAVFRDLPDDLELEVTPADQVNPYPTGAA
ncbi:hypothetical protein [Arthrobacter sp. 35W]|uniref:hypothetical protein n=1 Tax=Arthrobacter sp. 35W TaxID=1132441 RepID=UPI00040BBD08|nr:hypothetical protein [Arthrobacter sp. 35W]